MTAQDQDDQASIEGQSDGQNDVEPLSHTDLSWKVLGQLSSGDAAGVIGHNTSTDAGAVGVLGKSDASVDDSAGVKAVTDNLGPAMVAQATSGNGVGLRAVSDEGSAIVAENNDNLGAAISVDNTNSTGIANAVNADTESDEGEAIRATARHTGTGETHGIFAQTWSNADDLSAVYPAGVWGRATGDGATRGVQGNVTSDLGVGVVGYNLQDSSNYTEVNPDPMGVVGVTDYTGAETGTSLPLGMFGYATANSGTTRGILGKCDSPEGQAIEADHTQGGIAVKSNGRLGAEETIEGSSTSRSSYVAYVTNNQGTTGFANGLAITFPNRATDTDAGTNFIAFRSGGSASGSIEGNSSGGVLYESTGADYAEYMERLDPAAEIESGEVVGVVGGAITMETANASRVLVVSDDTAVCGNSPGSTPADRDDYETVAFTGQVPVKVRGPVDEGDLVVPSGEDDGTATAIDPAAWRPGTPIVGLAWGASEADDVSEVTVAVGIDDPSVLGATLEAQTDELEALREENKQLRERLAALEDRVASIEAPGSQPAVGDD